MPVMQPCWFTGFKANSMNNKDKPQFAKNIIFLRNQLKLTQEEASRLADVPIGTWASYEEGRAAPRLINLPKVLTVLQFTDVDALVNKDLANLEMEKTAGPDLNRIKLLLFELNKHFGIKK